MPFASPAEDMPPASVEAQVDRAEITIGDQIKYTLTVEYDLGVEVDKPSWGTGLEGFQILDYEVGEPVKVGDRFRMVDTYTISTFTPEDYLIPPLQVPIRLVSGATQVLETQPISVSVRSLLPEDEEAALELRDLKDPVPVYSGILTGRVLAIALAVLAVLILAFLLWRRSRREEIAEAVIPPRPEHEVALERLAELRIRLAEWPTEPDQPTCKQFGLELSEALREYLERRFEFLALEMTTTEVMDFLTMNNGEVGSVREDVHVILDQTDLLKFAKAVQSVASLLGWVEKSEGVVQDTRRRPAIEIDQDNQSETEGQKEAA